MTVAFPALVPCAAAGFGVEFAPVMKPDAALLTELIEPAVNGFGLDLWGVERTGQGRFTRLRVYIDGEAGVDIDDCERVSRQLSAILDVEDPIAGGYTLEVSSPGLERPLFTIGQFARFTGAEVALSTRRPRDGRRRFKGTIAAVDEAAGSIRIEADGAGFEFAHGDIEKANLVYNP